MLRVLFAVEMPKMLNWNIRSDFHQFLNVCGPAFVYMIIVDELNLVLIFYHKVWKQ
jgi:hypothetical protein